MAVVMMSIAPQVPKAVARFGAHRVVPVGLSFVGVGLAVFSQVDIDTSVWFIYAAILPLAAGMATTMTPLTTLIMSSVPLGKAGVGSAMNDTTRELGGALGVAVLGSLVTSRYVASLSSAVSGLPSAVADEANKGLGNALGVAASIGGEAGDGLGLAARMAFVDGIGLAAIVGSIVVFSAAAIAFFLLPSSHVLPTAGGPGARTSTGGTGTVPGSGSASAGPVDRPIGVDPTDPVHAPAAGTVIDDGQPEPAPVID
jgi:hypothetical protein